jgi:hypothetical protein
MGLAIGFALLITATILLIKIAKSSLEKPSATAV